MVCGFCAGKTNIEISNFNNIPHGTVRNFRMVWNKFLEDGGREEDYDVTRAKGKRRSEKKWGSDPPKAAGADPPPDILGKVQSYHVRCLNLCNRP